MSDVSIPPLTSNHGRAIIVEIGWRKLILPFNNNNMLLAAQLLEQTGGKIYDDEWLDDTRANQIGSTSRRYYPENDINLRIETITVSNRKCDATDFRLALEEEQPEPLLQAAE